MVRLDARLGMMELSSGRILALGARDPRFKPGLGPSFFPPSTTYIGEGERGDHGVSKMKKGDVYSAKRLRKCKSED